MERDIRAVRALVALLVFIAVATILFWLNSPSDRSRYASLSRPERVLYERYVSEYAEDVRLEMIELQKEGRWEEFVSQGQFDAVVRAGFKQLVSKEIAGIELSQGGVSTNVECWEDLQESKNENEILLVVIYWKKGGDKEQNFVFRKGGTSYRAEQQEIEEFKNKQGVFWTFPRKK